MTPKQLVTPLLALVMPVAAAAAPLAVSSSWVDLYAGPAPDYPLVAHVGPHTAMTVQGCTAGFVWCDVLVGTDLRGWVDARTISFAYRSANVPVIRYGAVIGIPIVSFVIGSYWRTYYRDRPWYGNLQRWERHRPPPRPGPIVRPAVRPGPGVHPPGAVPRPIVRPPVSTRPIGAHSPGHPRPPAARAPSGRLSGAHPPTARSPNTHPPHAKPPGHRRPSGAGRPGEADRPEGGVRPAPR